jgi:hypothetical protein
MKLFLIPGSAERSLAISDNRTVFGGMGEDSWTRTAGGGCKL